MHPSNNLHRLTPTAFPSASLDEYKKETEGNGSPLPAPLMPTQEQRRKQVMNAHVQWGDLVAPASRVGRTQPPTDQPPAMDDDQIKALFEASVADHISKAMNARDKDQPSQSNSSRPSSRDWSLDKLLSNSCFHQVRRVSAILSPAELQSEIAKVDEDGLPLIIEGCHLLSKWPTEMFKVDWLLKNVSEKIATRNVHNSTDSKCPLPEFIEKCRALPKFAPADETERLYGKDVECPPEWEKWLHESDVLPSEVLLKNPNNFMQDLPEKQQVETLMCYLGIGDTFTAAHKDLCASSGQNLMCYTENNGSSLWFLTESSSAPDAVDYFQKLGQELDLETHFVTVEELSKAPFRVYVAEQKLGDLVLVPPRSCHQVMNSGGITIKTSWSRMTLKGLAAALYHELPMYRRVCRPDTYRIKATIYHALLNYTNDLQDTMAPSPGPSTPTSASASASSRTQSPQRFPTSFSRNVPRGQSTPPSSIIHVKTRLIEQARILKELLTLFDDVLHEEFHTHHKDLQLASSEDAPLGFDKCSFCGCDTFQSLFECRRCADAGQSTIVVCPQCYVEGRTCKCGSMTPVQSRPFDELLSDHSRAVQVLVDFSTKEKDMSFAPIPQFNTKAVSSTDSAAIFEAACLLHKVRGEDIDKIEDRTCNLAHRVPRVALLSCKKCHHGLCFDHVLEKKRIHSTTALLSRQGDETHEKWHLFHVKGKARYESELPNAETAEKEGTRSNLACRLVRNASKFTTCKPHSLSCVKPGFYDAFIQVIAIQERVPIEKPPCMAEETSTPPLSPLTPASSPPASPKGASITPAKRPPVPARSLRKSKPPLQPPVLIRPSTPPSVSLTPLKKGQRQIFDCVLLSPVSVVYGKRRRPEETPSLATKKTKVATVAKPKAQTTPGNQRREAAVGSTDRDGNPSTSTLSSKTPAASHSEVALPKKLAGTSRTNSQVTGEPEQRASASTTTTILASLTPKLPPSPQTQDSVAKRRAPCDADDVADTTADDDDDEVARPAKRPRIRRPSGLRVVPEDPPASDATITGDVSMLRFQKRRPQPSSAILAEGERRGPSALTQATISTQATPLVHVPQESSPRIQRMQRINASQRPSGTTNATHSLVGVDHALPAGLPSHYERRILDAERRLDLAQGKNNHLEARITQLSEEHRVELATLRENFARHQEEAKQVNEKLGTSLEEVLQKMSALEKRIEGTHVPPNEDPPPDIAKNLADMFGVVNGRLGNIQQANDYLCAAVASTLRTPMPQNSPIVFTTGGLQMLPSTHFQQQGMPERYPEHPFSAPPLYSRSAPNHAPRGRGRGRGPAAWTSRQSSDHYPPRTNSYDSRSHSHPTYFGPPAPSEPRAFSTTEDQEERSRNSRRETREHPSVGNGPLKSSKHRNKTRWDITQSAPVTVESASTEVESSHAALPLGRKGDASQPNTNGPHPSDGISASRSPREESEKSPLIEDRNPTVEDSQDWEGSYEQPEEQAAPAAERRDPAELMASKVQPSANTPTPLGMLDNPWVAGS